MIDIVVYNTEYISKAFQELDKDLRKSILRRVYDKIAKPIIEEAKNRIWKHQIKGRLYRSIGTVNSTDDNNMPMLILGARMFGKYKGYHAHFLENGTKKRYYKTKKGKMKYTGEVKGIRYWDSSLSKGEINKMPEFIVDEMEKTLGKFDNKIRKINL